MYHTTHKYAAPFFQKLSLEIEGVAYLWENFHFHTRSNAWLLSLECSAHILVVMQKSMEKLC